MILYWSRDDLQKKPQYQALSISLKEVCALRPDRCERGIKAANDRHFFFFLDKIIKMVLIFN